MSQTTVSERKELLKAGAIRIRRCQNKDDLELWPGDVVVLDTANSSDSNIAIKASNTSDDIDVYGIAIQHIVAGEYGEIQTEGPTAIVTVRADGNTNIAVGDELAMIDGSTYGDYTTGDITVTNGSGAVVGNGTTFTSAMVGRYLYIDSATTKYRISAFTDTTNITITPVYRGTTASGASYTITAECRAMKATAGKGGAFATSLEAYTTDDCAGELSAILFPPSRVDSTAAGAGDLLADGTVPLTANWDVGAYKITGLTFTSDQATGTAPFTVASTTVVTNLNADLLDGNSAAYFAVASHAMATHSDEDSYSISTSGTLASGNATITGDLSVSGALTFGGNWTVGATLTVDELILDTDGTAPDGTTHNYVVRDNTGDLTLNAQSSKTINLAINDVDEYAFGAASVDLNSNHLDNAGYLIVNEVTLPANTECYVGRDNTGDTTVHAIDNKEVHLSVVGVEEVDVSKTETVINEAGNDRDFRVESTNIDPLFLCDGGKDAVSFGAAADTDNFVLIKAGARTITSGENFANLWVEPAGTVTSQGTNAIVATVYLKEPNITDTGTANACATLYIADAPTEGNTSNDAIRVAAGSVYLAGTTQCVGILTCSDDIKMATTKSITDAGGDELLTFVESGTPVDEFTITSADANGEPILSVTGGDTDITMQLLAKGDAGFNFKSGTVGDAARPDIHLQDDADTGLFGGTNILGISTQGTVRLSFDANGNPLFFGATASTSGTQVIGIKNRGVAPDSNPADCVQLFAEDVSTSSELRVRDEGGTVTTLSPHAFTQFDKPDPMAWSYHSENSETGQEINVDMFTAIREIEKLSGKKLIHIKKL